MLPLDDRQEWFRYHHKFSELLYERMKRTEPAQINMIYRGASGWFEQQGMTDHAIDYAIRAQDYLPAARLIGQIGKNLFWTGDPRQILNWLEAMPDMIYSVHPSLWLLHLWAHVTLAQFSTVADELVSERQKAILSGISSETARKELESLLAVIRALIAINVRYDIPEGLHYAKLGMENHGDDGISGVMAPLLYGKASMLNGELENARGLLDQSWVGVERARSPFMRMIVTHHRSELAFFQGDLKKMERLLKEAYQIGMEAHMDDASAFFKSLHRHRQAEL